MPDGSRLSRTAKCFIVVGGIGVVAIAVVFALRTAFSWKDAAVLAATSLQSFVVLSFVHYTIFRRNDLLSWDAIIKLFAAGFLIAVPAAFVAEGLLENICGFVAWLFGRLLSTVVGSSSNGFLDGQSLVLWVLAEVVYAYAVSALVEELCKYYTYRLIQHPDLYPTDSTLDREQDRSRGRSGKESDESTLATRESFIEIFISLDGDGESSRRDKTDMERSYRQKAMAITTGMISVAVGFACAENFLYVFILAGTSSSGDADASYQADIAGAWLVLLCRTIFPVHALSAALQSTNMIRRCVEQPAKRQEPKIRVRRIVLPAVVLHGSFDAVLDGLAVFNEYAGITGSTDGGRGGGEAQGSNDSSSIKHLVSNIVAWVGVSVIMLVGLAWYIREYSQQQLRLKALEDRKRKKMRRQWVAGPSSTRIIKCPSKILVI